MTRQDYMLAVLAAGYGTVHNAVQVQKLFFLLDRKAADLVGGPWFAFEPDAYGPLDTAVFEELRGLEARGLVSIRVGPGYYRTYELTAEGLAKGQEFLATYPGPTADYIRQLSAWVRNLSFRELVASIYHEFPEMRVNAVFQGAK